MSPNHGDSSSVSRRSALKLISGAGASLAAGTSISAASDTGVTDREEFSPYPEGKPIRYHNSLRRVTNEPHTLALSSEAIDRHFDNSDLEGREFEQAKTYLTNLRNRYPTERIEGPYYEWIVLSNEARRTLRNPSRRQRTLVGRESEVESLSQSDEGGLPSIQSEADVHARRSAFSVFADSDDEDDEQISTQWEPNHHEKILQTALDDVDSDASMARWAGDPDSFNEIANGRLGVDDGDLDIDLPDWTPLPENQIADRIASALQTAMDRLFKNYGQYYDPNTVKMTIPYVGEATIEGIGMAPHSSQSFKTAAAGSRGYNERKFLSYSTHYLHDMAVPLHTGMGIEQAGITWDIDLYNRELSYDLNPKKWAHYGLEGLVRDNWDDQREFVDDFSGSRTSISNAFAATRNMSLISSAYSSNMFHKILENGEEPDNRNQPYWEDWSNKDEILDGIATCFRFLWPIQ